MTELNSSEIDSEDIPGTTYLVNTKINPAELNETVKKEIVLIPHPSNNPKDPLNWSRRRKLIQVFCLILFCYGGGVASCCIYPLLEEIAADPSANVTIDNLNNGTGYNFLFLGLGQFLMTPLAQQFGKRPAYLLAMLGNLVFCLWMPYIHSNGQWIASQILSGLFYAPIESLPSNTITDLFFEHERGTYIGIYSVALGTSNFIAPMLSGFVAEALGWKWAVKIAVIFDAVCLIAMFFLIEETNYEREPSLEGEITESEGIQLASTTFPDKNEVINCTVSPDTNFDKHMSTAISNHEIEYPAGKGYWARLSLLSGAQKKNHIFDYILMILHMFRFPPILWSGFLYGVSLFFYSIINTTESIILSAPPYNFSTSMLGLAYLSPVIFVLLFYPYAGWSIDWIKIRKAKKHKGISQAEDRLPVLFLFMILGPASLVIYGVGAAHGINWFGVIFGMGLMAGFSIVGATSSITYALDCYPEAGMAGMAVVILIRNVMNFALDYGITPFIDNCGIQTTYIACAFICLGCIGTYFLMERTGLYWRKKTKGKYWHLVAKYRQRGVIQ